VSDSSEGDALPEQETKDEMAVFVLEFMRRTLHPGFRSSGLACSRAIAATIESEVIRTDERCMPCAQSAARGNVLTSAREWRRLHREPVKHEIRKPLERS
jgi:hypothetical protein